MIAYFAAGAALAVVACWSVVIVLGRRVQRGVGLAISPRQGVLRFSTNDEFFEYQCAFGETRLRVGKVLIGQIVNDVTDFHIPGMPDPPEGPDFQAFRIMVPTRDGGRAVNGSKLSGSTKLRRGDLVAYLPLHHSNAVIDFWHGAIVAKLEPEISHEGPKVAVMF